MAHKDEDLWAGWCWCWARFVGCVAVVVMGVLFFVGVIVVGPGAHLLLMMGKVWVIMHWFRRGEMKMMQAAKERKRE